MRDVASYRAKAHELRARAEASTTAAEASNYLELAAAWEQLARQAEAHLAPEPRALES
jgi:hypothetical protein